MVLSCPCEQSLTKLNHIGNDQLEFLIDKSLQCLLKTAQLMLIKKELSANSDKYPFRSATSWIILSVALPVGDCITE